MRADHARSGIVDVSGVVVGVRIVQCHAIMNVVFGVRVMQYHAIIDVVIGVRVMLCHAIMFNPLLWISHFLSQFSSCCQTVSIHHHLSLWPFCAHFCTAKTRHLRCGIYTPRRLQ